MGLAEYSIAYSGGLGSAPSSRTFAQLGITAAKIVSVAGGGDYADLTVDVSVDKPGMPFVPLARHAIYDDRGVLRFVGWLMKPARSADATTQRQTFRLSGPMCKLAEKVFQQPWNFALDPLNYDSEVNPQMIPRVILNLQDYVANTRVSVAQQLQEVLDYAIGLGVPIDYGSLDAIPAVQPTEDEQVDMYCDKIIARQLRWVPKVTAYWSYPPQVPLKPKLNFCANDAVPAASITAVAQGTLHFPPEVGLMYVPSAGGILIDLNSGRINDFSSESRYDLLVSKVTVFYENEQDVTSDGSITGTRKMWVTLSQDVSTVANGSDKELTYCFDLRSAGGLRDPVTGLLQTQQEIAPTGLAAALHDGFKVLTHSLSWSIVAQDVDWTTYPGQPVGVVNGGDDLLKGSRSIIQQISRDIGTGTTSYTAGPLAKLGINDMILLTRFNRSRNASRSVGSGKQGGPNQKNHGYNPTTDVGGGGGGGGGSALSNVAYDVVQDGQRATATIPTVSVVIDP